MTTDVSDVVAELDRWIDSKNASLPDADALIQRARDEIVALRREVVGLIKDGTVACDDIARLENEADAVRNAALEEAALGCEREDAKRGALGSGARACRDCAAAIRALKDA